MCGEVWVSGTMRVCVCASPGLRCADKGRLWMRVWLWRRQGVSVWFGVWLWLPWVPEAPAPDPQEAARRGTRGPTDVAVVGRSGHI